MLSSVETNESPNRWKQLEDSKTLHAYWSVDFAIHNEHEKSCMKEAANDFPNLVSSLNHRSEQMPIEEYVQSTW